MLATLKEVLAKAEVGGYAVPQFNVSNLESVKAVLAAAQAKKSPVIVAASEGAIKHAGLDYLTAIFEVALSESEKLPIVLHLDHGKSLEICETAINAGFSSVMIDASDLPYEENIMVSRKVVEIAHPKGVSVEAELGRILGMEEAIKVEKREVLFTDPNQAAEFVKETGVDALAVSIGTAHGVYKFAGEPKLDFERLQAIKKKVSIPLVLHGASEIDQSLVKKAEKYGAKLEGALGVPAEDIEKAISLGVAKVNTDSDLNLATVAALREELATQPDNVKMYKILEKAFLAYREVAERRIDVLGSSNKE